MGKDRIGFDSGGWVLAASHPRDLQSLIDREGNLIRY